MSERVEQGLGFAFDEPKAQPKLKADHWSLEDPSPFGSLIAVLNGYPVGAIRLYSVTLSSKFTLMDCVGFGCVWVHPDYRGRGVASQMLERATDPDLNAEGFPLALLYSRYRNLYSKAGFKIIKMDVHDRPGNALWYKSITNNRKTTLFPKKDWETPNIGHF
jgi:GNAT superfamily N-acetyltransferase